MSQAPVWVTEAGSLGVVPEGKFYQITLEAVDPDLAGPVEYSLVAGQLPAGIQVDTDGIIAGIPVSIAETRGVPAEVSENVTSKFVIRATDADDRIADRTFTLTVTGQDKPEWVTPEGAIGAWIDGTEVSFQFEAIDLDPGYEIEIVLIDGDLPEGLTLSTDGLLSGFPIPGQPTLNFEFTLRLDDDKDVSLRTFNMDIINNESLTADTTEITADSGNVTVDSIPGVSPYIVNNVPSLGSFRHDNYFAHRFDGRDPDSDQIEYYIASGAVPAGLTLDPDTGWLTGNLPNVGLTEQLYEFGVKVFKTIDPANESLLYETSMTLVGDIIVGAEWLTDADLGTIDNGEFSTFTVEAEYESTPLQYRLDHSVSSKLPQGLVLLSSGNIIGQVSFKTTMFDGGTTTFDEDFETRLDADPTTFDTVFNFTVEAYSSSGTVSILREFTITVNNAYDSPHNIVYCKAMPPQADRDLIDSLLLNQDIIDPDLLYRADDPNFGAARRVVYEHAYGLAPATTEDYFTALNLNHYNKNLVLGELKTARALDDDDNVVYEVVYSQIIDDLVNAEGESVAAELPNMDPAIDDGAPVSTVYPNSLENMREQVVDQIGQVSKVLPRWMLSKQVDGEVLGFTPAWVIAYTIPEKSELLRYNILEAFGTQLNLVDFEIDRYTLNTKLSEHWDLDNQEWLSGAATTFDREPDSELETTFDSRATRFSSPVDIYDSSDTNDKYIKFPKEKIINNEQ